jgi:hypothetical protein
MNKDTLIFNQQEFKNVKELWDSLPTFYGDYTSFTVIYEDDTSIEVQDFEQAFELMLIDGSIELYGNIIEELAVYRRQIQIQSPLVTWEKPNLNELRNQLSKWGDVPIGEVPTYFTIEDVDGEILTVPDYHQAEKLMLLSSSVELSCIYVNQQLMLERE